jgi:hypothetical protein|tara:strand:- start:49 stop:540 length:492 start_codon:yes stop_codon:yes gene_type:complete
MKTIEGPLNTLGIILIALGWGAGFLAILVSFISDGQGWFYFILSLSFILSGYVSGYLFIGISNIIDLLLKLNSNIKTSLNSSRKTSDSINRSWEEISDRMKEKPKISKNKEGSYTIYGVMDNGDKKIIGIGKGDGREEAISDFLKSSNSKLKDFYKSFSAEAD